MFQRTTRVIWIVKATVLGCLMIFLTIPAFAANDIEGQIRQKSDELNAIKRQKQEIERKRQMASEAERSVSQRLKAIDEEIKKRERDLQSYNNKLNSETRKLKAVEFRINDLSFQSSLQAQRLKIRLRNFFKSNYQFQNESQVRISEIVNRRDLILKKEYFKSIVSADKRYIEKLNLERSIISGKKQEIDRSRGLIIAYKGKIGQEKSKFLLDRSKNRVLLVEYQGQKEAYTKTLNQLERSMVQLEALVNKLRSAQRPADQLELQLSTLSLDELGVLSWPITGRVIPNAISTLRGITIQADYGDDVRSIHDGVVEYAGLFDAIGLGQIVIINHGHNYRSIYAHLSDILIKQGRKVNRDQMIGKVGSIGGSGQPALYFEIRKGSYPVDVRRWLK